MTPGFGTIRAALRAVGGVAGTGVRTIVTRFDDIGVAHTRVNWGRSVTPRSASHAIGSVNTSHLDRHLSFDVGASPSNTVNSHGWMEPRPLATAPRPVLCEARV